jgi:ribose 5-phosphate isomerase B
LKAIVIGCDSAGVVLKSVITKYLQEIGVEFEDVGETIYPEVAKEVVDQIKASDFKKDGILICGTGLGMAITANKFKGIYAGVCHDTYSAERLRLSNNGNILCLGARVIGAELAKKIVCEWIGLEFKDGRSTTKVKKIMEYEKDNFIRT